MPSLRSLSVILLLALLLRLAAAMIWQSQAAADGGLFRLGDSDSYWVLAGHLARGEPYQYGSPNASVFRAPLFPIVLAPFTWIPDPAAAVASARVLGCLLGTLAVLELMLLASRLGGATAATGAGVIGAVSPSAIGMSVVVLSEMLLVPLMLAHLLLWQRAWSSSTFRETAKWSALAGAVAGAAVLARPSWLLFTPFLMFVGLSLGPNRWHHARIGLITALAMCVVMLPWWVRNARVTGKFVPTTLQVGPSLYDGLHPGATGASDEGMQFMQAIVAEQIAVDRRADRPLESTLEYRVNRRAQRQAVEFALSQPRETMRLAMAKLYRTWSVWPAGGDIGSTPLRLAITLGTVIVLVLAIYGTWLTLRQHPWWVGVCWLPCLYFTLLHMVFVGSIRYREPAVFILAALAGCAMADLARRRILIHRSAPGRHATASEPSR